MLRFIIYSDEDVRNPPIENNRTTGSNKQTDRNLGYDPRLRPFVREWLEFGNGNSPDLLDAAYCAVKRLDVRHNTDTPAAHAGLFYNHG